MNKEELAYLQKVDPLKKQVEVSAKDRGADLSPMSPPEAHTPPSSVKVEYEQMHPYLKKLVDEHNDLKLVMGEFRKTVDHIGISRETTGRVDKSVRNFFNIFMTDFLVHNREEEKVLFPVLAKRFLEIGEHSKAANPITPIDVLMSEHIEALQVAVEAKCTWELLQQVFDPPSQTILLGNFMRKTNTLLEMMKLHIFREDDIVFSLAQKHLTQEELDSLIK